LIPAYGCNAFKLAALSVLAKLPERHATLDEIKHEIQTIIVNQDETEQLKRFGLLGDIDIIQSGLVSRGDNGFQITEAGISLLHSLESPSNGRHCAGPPASLLTPPLAITHRAGLANNIPISSSVQYFRLVLRRRQDWMPSTGRRRPIPERARRDWLKPGAARPPASFYEVR